MEEDLIQAAKAEAQRRGQSVSQMVAEYFDSLRGTGRTEPPLPPITASLVGVLKGHADSGGDYREHLDDKYL